MEIKENGISSIYLPEVAKEADNKKNDTATFEQAITAVQWGKFHLLMYAISITSGWSSIMETTVMSYVFPAAECDLDLNLESKGLLNAITYIGMISSGFIWGYLCDTLGRRKLMITGYLLDGVAQLSAAMSQNFTMLMISKFFGGLIINGPFSAITTYLSELHSSTHRSKAQFLLGIIYSTGTLFLPILAIYILPLKFRWQMGDFVIHSWNVYIFICAFVPLFSGFAFMFLPESPKFLMTVGRNDEALKVFKMIYAMNSGNDPDTYPIKSLVDEIEMSQGNKYGKVTANRSSKEAFVEGLQQMRPLLHRPYLSKLILVCTIQLLTMNSLNTLRLWLPQLFQAMNDFEMSHPNQTAPLCDSLAVFRPNKTELILDASEECVVNTNNLSVYTNSIIVCAVTILTYVVAGSLINKIGKKRMFGLLSIISGLSAISMYFSNSTVVTLTIASMFVASGSVMINCLLAITVSVFPTTLRTMTVSLAMMMGRSGAVFGNSIYPMLLQLGCAPPFFYNGCLCFACALLGLLLPSTESTAMT